MSALIVVDGMHKGNRRFPLEPSLIIVLLITHIVNNNN